MARPVDISDEAIIDVAQVLFLEKGIAATEMKDIAQRAKIGRTTTMCSPAISRTLYSSLILIGRFSSSTCKYRKIFRET